MDIKYLKRPQKIRETSELDLIETKTQEEKLVCKYHRVFETLEEVYLRLFPILDTFLIPHIINIAAQYLCCKRVAFNEWVLKNEFLNLINAKVLNRPSDMKKLPKSIGRGRSLGPSLSDFSYEGIKRKVIGTDYILWHFADDDPYKDIIKSALGKHGPDYDSDEYYNNKEQYDKERHDSKKFCDDKKLCDGKKPCDNEHYNKKSNDEQCLGDFLTVAEKTRDVNDINVKDFSIKDIYFATFGKSYQGTESRIICTLQNSTGNEKCVYAELSPFSYTIRSAKNLDEMYYGVMSRWERKIFREHNSPSILAGPIKDLEIERDKYGEPIKFAALESNLSIALYTKNIFAIEIDDNKANERMWMEY